jgi:hypothetical protein
VIALKLDALIELVPDGKEVGTSCVRCAANIPACYWLYLLSVMLTLRLACDITLTAGLMDAAHCCAFGSQQRTIDLSIGHTVVPCDGLYHTTIYMVYASSIVVVCCGYI